MGIAYNSKIVTDGLVLCLDAANPKSYPGSGTTWYDLSGNGNHGTLTNGPTFNSDNKGSIVFDNTDDIVKCGNLSNLQLIDKITLIGFIKPITKNTNVSPLICKWSGTLNQRAYYFGIINNKAWFALSSNGLGGYPTAISTTNLILDLWYHISATWDKSIGDMNIYINGDLNTTTPNVTNSIFNSNRECAIGSEDAGYSPTTMRKISQVQIYNRALSSSEIAQNFNATRGRYGI